MANSIRLAPFFLPDLVFKMDFRFDNDITLLALGPVLVVLSLLAPNCGGADSARASAV